VEPPQEENGWQTASEVNGRFFLMSLASVAVAKAVEHQSTARARRAVPLDVGRTVQKVRVQLVVYRPSNEGVLLRPRLIAMV
jgi:hypothetical protein